MNAKKILADQRQLLDRLVLAGLLPAERYLAERMLIADAASVRCAQHPAVVALIYGPDEHTPLCGPCAVTAYQAALKERTV